MELFENISKPVHFALYRAEPKMRELLKVQIFTMVPRKAVVPTQTELTVPIVFAPIKKETLRVFFDYKRLTPVSKNIYFQSYKWMHLFVSRRC